MRRIAILSLVLFALIGAACGSDDDDSTVASKPDTTDDTSGPAQDEENGADGQAALEFFQSTERACADHADATGNEPVDPSLFAKASYDADESKMAGGPVVVDGAGTPLLVDVEAETITSVDGPDAAMPRPYSFSCPPEVYVGTIDDGGGATGDPCPEWAGWMTDGEESHLTEMQAMLRDDPASGEILEALEFLLSDPPTETPDEQSNYEAVVDIITSDLADQFGCETTNG